MRPIRLTLALASASVLLLPAAARAAVTAAATARPASGLAPLAVTLDASGSRSDQAGGVTAYAWAFGDGTTGSGVTVAHSYAAAGDYAATVTVSDATGATAQATVAVHATASGTLTLVLPAGPTTFGHGAALSGVLTPAAAGQKVRVEAHRSGRWTTLGVATTAASGAWHLALRARQPDQLRARWSGSLGPVVGAVSGPATLVVRPALVLSPPTATIFGSVTIAGRIAPARPGGHVLVTARRGARVVFSRRVALAGGRRFSVAAPAATAGRYAVSVTFAADGFYSGVALGRSVRAAYPALAYGASGPAVAALRRTLAGLGYRQATGGAGYGADLIDAVLAFQKVQGLERTGSVDAAVWSALAAPKRPTLRYPGQGDHIEVDKARQVLLVARGGKVAWIVPVSTGGPGKFTPEGTYAIQRKVTGFDPSPLGTLYDPMYFTGGYAIHGNPSVPAYPASHGCVRVPMWAAAWLYDANQIGEAIDVYT